MIVPISQTIPMTYISQTPRSLPVGSVLGDDTRRSATTFPIRHPSNQTDVHILHVVEEDVEILDGCHTLGCGMTSSLMRKCQHCQVISLSFVPTQFMILSVLWYRGGCAHGHMFVLLLSISRPVLYFYRLGYEFCARACLETESPSAILSVFEKCHL